MVDRVTLWNRVSAEEPNIDDLVSALDPAGKPKVTVALLIDGGRPKPARTFESALREEAKLVWGLRERHRIERRHLIANLLQAFELSGGSAHPSCSCPFCSST
jgi:hypothetical protein